MNVLALTIGDQTLASTHYRLAQFKDLLESRGIRLSMAKANEFRDWSTLSRYDLVILQKRLPRISLIRRIRKEAKCLIFDTDDAIWEPHGRKHSWWTRFRTNRRLKAIAGAANACTVPNEYLAKALRPLAQRVELLPMALDETEWKPPEERAPGPIRLGWSGAPANLPYLTGLGKALEEVQASRPDVTVIVYCGEAPAWAHRVTSLHHPYKPGTEAGVVKTFDIGLLPLPDNAFAAGKSPIKALQYAACGIPCVASPVGATLEVVQDGVTGLRAGSQSQWRDALLRLIDDEQERRRLGDEARRRFIQNHARTQNVDRMIRIWRDVAAGPTSS